MIGKADFLLQATREQKKVGKMEIEEDASGLNAIDSKDQRQQRLL